MAANTQRARGPPVDSDVTDVSVSRVTRSSSLDTGHAALWDFGSSSHPHSMSIFLFIMITYDVSREWAVDTGASAEKNVATINQKWLPTTK